MTDVVLLHGTTQTAAGFDRLAAELRARGHRPLTVTVPEGTARTAAGIADAMTAGLPADLLRPVVAAHSGSGVLLPELAARLDARHQVWIAAAVADHAGRRSLLEEIRADPTAVFRPEWIGTDPTSDPVLATYFLFHDADLATLREVLSTVHRCDLSDVFAEVPRIDPAARPSTYIRPAGDRSLDAGWMERVAHDRLGVEPTVLDGGHNLYVAHPAAVADVVDRAARR
ncbi:alpha/beta hydrolase [Pseudonocardia nematodicida]|uniref:Alpha/beta hydrolase n=1 Tax=Pseudonocardia nematodicida TaxID=1206997 RepID=A0ABV1KAZ8_9PSEU